MINNPPLAVQIIGALVGTTGIGASLYKLSVYVSRLKLAKKPDFSANESMNKMLITNLAEMDKITDLYHKTRGENVELKCENVELKYENHILKKWAREAIAIFKKLNIVYRSLGEIVKGE